MLNSKGCENDPCTKYYKLDEKIKDGIVNGGEWKQTNRTMQDWSYLWSTCFDIGFFIGCEKRPNPNRLFDYWLENRVAFTSFMKQAHRGVKGLLINETTKDVISTMDLITVNVEGVKSEIVLSKGDYFLLLTPGLYNISINDR